MPRLTLLDAGNLRERGSGRSFIDPPSIWELACSFFLCLQKNRVIWAGRLMWSHLDIFHGCVWKKGKNLLLKNWTIRLEPTKGSSCDITYMSYWWGGVCESAQFLFRGEKGMVWLGVWVCISYIGVSVFRPAACQYLPQTPWHASPTQDMICSGLDLCCLQI